MEDFGQKAKQSFKMGLNFLHKKAQQTLDLTKLQGQLKQAQEKKEQALLTLGERVCAMFDMDTFAAEELKDGVEAVRTAQAQIAELEKHIQEVREADEKAASPEDSHEPPSP
jgi:hypothetical protein